ncbi:tachyzoite surface protein [Cystoisospora suis]|uniref:Tachyzoite surface protein n=1 Tax=Cystoisospora suis TaxID=483139 RepID=A0A2C6L868_9APIC|nr:tachyzoite surface protein [Cystoisospora suis]
MVTVHIQPREAEVEGQVARCAYGHNVRTRRLSLTPEKNELTVICGGEGRLVPEQNFASEYCADSDEFGVCETQQFSALFPRFNVNWWTGDSTAATLTIPKDSFPRESKKFNLVCRSHKYEGEDKEQDCVVGVDVSPGSSFRKPDSGKQQPGTTPAGSGTGGSEPSKSRSVPQGSGSNPQGSGQGQNSGGQQGGQGAQEVAKTAKNTGGKTQKSGAYGFSIEGSLAALLFAAGVAVSSSSI